MKRLFVVVLLSFLASLLFFIAVMTASFYLGYRKSIAGWGREKLRAVEGELVRTLEEILPPTVGGELSLERFELLAARVAQAVPAGIPVAVYDREGKPIFRRGPGPQMGGTRMGGMGRMHMEGPRDPWGPEGPGVGPGRGMGPRLSEAAIPMKQVKVGGEVVGYYRIGIPGFGTDRANARFIRSMRRTVWIGGVLSFVIAFCFALILSGRLGRSANRVSEGLQRMAAGRLSEKIAEDGVREMAVIARAANELARKLGMEEEIRTQWAADVSHDLRTPIAAVRAQLEGMRDGVLDLTRERIGRNLEEIARIEALVEDLAELTRLESPAMRLKPETVSARRLCRDLKTRFEGDIESKGIRAEFECGNETFAADENLMLRALSNLMTNAVRHTPEGGTIRMVFSQDQAVHRVAISNTGEGIPEEEIDRVFQRLYRGERARKTPGSGLGLTIALKIAELHGGTVSISSEEGRETTVTMSVSRDIRPRDG